MCVDKDFNDSRNEIVHLNSINCVFGSVLLTHKPGLNDKRLLKK